MPRTFYQQPNTDNLNLVALLMKNLTAQEQAKPVNKPNELEKAKPKEEEKPAIELKALPGQKAEERRQQSESKNLGGTSLFEQIAQPKSSLAEFKAKFKNSRDEKAEQEAYDRFEKAKELTALYRRVEAPVIELKQSSLADEVKADPKFKSLGVNTLTGKRTEFKYDNALELLLRNRDPGEQPQSEFETPRLEPVRRFRIGGPKTLAESVSGEKAFQPAKNLVFKPATPETFEKLGESQLTVPAEQGPSLATLIAEEAVAELKEPPLIGTEGGGEIVPISLPQAREQEFVFTEGQSIPAPLNLPEAPLEPIQTAEEEANLGSELLPPVEEKSTILNQPPAPSTTEQLFNPQREPSLAEIIEPKVKKPSSRKQTIQQLATDAGIPIFGAYSYENERGEVVNKKSGDVPLFVLSRKLREKGAPAELVPDEWLIKPKSGFPSTKGE
jgi:hypothetical protein